VRGPMDDGDRRDGPGIGTWQPPYHTSARGRGQTDDYELHACMMHGCTMQCGCVDGSTIRACIHIVPTWITDEV
jgi:hypothetical protein